MRERERDRERENERERERERERQRERQRVTANFVSFSSLLKGDEGCHQVIINLCFACL